MVLPVYQKYGYGRFLIEFSYLLSKREEMAGTPEKPLSDLGRLSYESYWKFKVLEYIDQHRNSRITIENISKSTGMNFVDIAATLQKNDLLKYRDDKSGPKYEIVMNEHLWQSSKRPKITVNEEALRWTPLVFLSNQSNESMEADVANETSVPPTDEPDEKELKSGPVNSNSASTNGQVVKKKKRRRWKNKTGFDTKKPKKKSPNLTNGNGKQAPANNGADLEDASNSDNKTSKDEEEEDATEADGDSTEEDEYRIESSDDDYGIDGDERLDSNFFERKNSSEDLRY